MAEGQRTNRALVPGARQALDQFKYQVASELGLPNYQGYLGDIPARQHGAVGGNMVRRMIQLAEQQLAGGGGALAGGGGALGGGGTIPQGQQQQRQPGQIR